MSMNIEKSLKYLKCNKCNSIRLKLIDHSKIECEDCNYYYPIEDGIVYTYPSVITSTKVNIKPRRFNSTMKSYTNWWLKVNKGIGYKQNLSKLFTAQTGKDIGFLDGKTILDAGCGGGRFLRYVAQARESTIIAFDLGGGIKLAKELNKETNNIIFIQGNILNPPFRASAFDFIYSFGVLHHTPAPKNAFLSLSQTLKEGGFFSIYLYYRPYLTANDRGIKFALQQNIQYLYREPLRIFVTYLPHHLILGWSRIIYYLNLFERIKNSNRLQKLMKKMLRVIIPPGKYRTLESKEHNIIRNYDHYSTRYNFTHTHEEVLQWFQEAHFNNVIIKKLPLSMIGQKCSYLCDPLTVTYFKPSPEDWDRLESEGL